MQRALVACVINIPGAWSGGRGGREVLVELIDGSAAPGVVDSLVSDIIRGGHRNSSGTFGHVAIPLGSIFEQPVGDGWHLLQGCEGEVRIGWMLLSRPPTKLHSLPSPSGWLGKRAAAKAQTMLEAMPLPEAVPFQGTNPAAAAAEAEAEAGAAAEGGVAGGLPLTVSQVVASHDPKVRRGLYLTQGCWLPEWRGDANDAAPREWKPNFMDPSGFTVRMANAHSWQVTHSHRRCLTQRLFTQRLFTQRLFHPAPPRPGRCRTRTGAASSSAARAAGRRCSPRWKRTSRCRGRRRRRWEGRA
jgi:hypothetical protein